MASRQPFNVTGKIPATATLEQQEQHSPWHSPIPYLFGGLAAMLGLIAFALLILACSYWKLSGYLENNDAGEGDRDLEAGEGKGNGDKLKAAPPVFEDQFVVIMAGDVKPSFLATPIGSRSSSVDEDGNCSRSNSPANGENLGKVTEKGKQGSSDQVQSGNIESHDHSDNDH